MTQPFYLILKFMWDSGWNPDENAYMQGVTVSSGKGYPRFYEPPLAVAVLPSNDLVMCARYHVFTAGCISHPRRLSQCAPLWHPRL
ncbi:hypothetical protein AG1IA_08421 [Rhizoctonia solani AG-1 IA]|uniref:Uncharacterized protein n=1 Tax=Thanatephorus cucumeris (strain AG1-IA) TaxID=983506 RepID=L8WLC6_THACA|nr:hypothetical protein AG1IA_08421 [Rhizoctonia solani AG-1 IA]